MASTCLKKWTSFCDCHLSEKHFRDGKFSLSSVTLHYNINHLFFNINFFASEMEASIHKVQKRFDGTGWCLGASAAEISAKTNTRLPSIEIDQVVAKKPSEPNACHSISFFPVRSRVTSLEIDREIDILAVLDPSIVTDLNDLCAWYIHHGFAQFYVGEFRGSRAHYMFWWWMERKLRLLCCVL